MYIYNIYINTLWVQTISWGWSKATAVTTPLGIFILKSSLILGFVVWQLLFKSIITLMSCNPTLKFHLKHLKIQLYNKRL